LHLIGVAALSGIIGLVTIVSCRSSFAHPRVMHWHDAIAFVVQRDFADETVEIVSVAGFARGSPRATN
jgi:hypothetical protein